MDHDGYFSGGTSSKLFTHTASSQPAVSGAHGGTVDHHHSRLSVLKRALRVDDNAQSFRLSTPGRSVVNSTFDRLGKPWVVLNHIPAGAFGGVVDHLLIGPAGVFAINVKSLKGKAALYDHSLTLNGRKRDDLEVARRQADLVSTALTRVTQSIVHAQPVLVLVSNSLERRRDPSDVTVLTARQLKRWVRGQRGQRLTDSMCNSIERVARLESTWR